MRKAQLLASAFAVGLLSVPLAADPALADSTPGQGLYATQLAATNATIPYSYRNVQQLLNDLGYNVGTPDGVIGSRTRTAIRAFQADEGLPQSGEPSRTLFDSLQTAWSKRFGGQQQAAQPSLPSTSASTAATANAELVMNVQQELRDRGYNVALNGQLDTATASAIREYQRGAHLSVTGQASDSLLASLQAAPRGGTSRFSQQQIMNVQSALNDLGYNAGPEDGVPGPRLHEAIRLYQTKQGLDPTGEISTALISSLDAGSSTSSTTTAQTQTKLVKKTENRLQQLGYVVGPIDGTLDAQTTAAIKQYQRDNSLSITGQPSSSLLTKLQGTQTSAVTRSTATVAPAVSASVIKQIETELEDKGYDVGPIDGKLDAQTSAAISTYQRHAGLTQTGQPSQALLQNLQSSSVTAKSGSVGDVINTLGSFIQQSQ